ncbi:MAG: hypothetical protein HYZ65_04670 [Burkholderiales bacterium]|nr:hypothetical protein [Burkholderiales bacterium]
MGIFSLFGKKGARRPDRSTEKSSVKKTRAQNENTAIGESQDSDLFSNSLMTQRHIARATERKIDAIEFEMSRDIVKSKATTTSPLTQHSTEIHPLDSGTAISTGGFESTVPMAMLPADYLLGHPSQMPLSTLAQIESVPLLEEAAILFASGQSLVAEQMLLNAIEQQQLGPAAQSGWQMLFDLHRIGGDQAKFESLSLEYARQFETSPPLWPENLQGSEVDAAAHADEHAANIAFPAKLDSGIVKPLEKLQTVSKQSRNLRLDFTRVKQVDPIGCGLLLRALRNLKKSGHDLMLVGAQELAEQIRAILRVGRRDETEAPWLLLLEILQLLQFENAFEEASMDYCVTFEVSPPAFEAPKNKVTSSFPEIAIHDELTDRFAMPAVIEGKTDFLLKNITEYARHHNPVVLDCSRLERVEFSASAQLLTGLAPIASQKEVSIRFEEVNYLVMMLFHAMGLKNVASIAPRKH